MVKFGYVGNAAALKFFACHVSLRGNIANGRALKTNTILVMASFFWQRLNVRILIV